MNWNLLGQIAAILIIKLISSSLFLLYFSQIFQKGPAVVYRHKNACRLGWELYEGNCYSFSEVEKTWDESQHSCASLNSSLAVVNNREELMFLKERTEGVNYFFIGLTKKGSGGQWKWIDNTVYDPDMFHMSVQDFDCGVVGLNTLSSMSCSVTNYWICEEI
nr:C-type lectin domain family 5 member A-like isoform X1 [Pogona vitticeps]